MPAEAERKQAEEVQKENTKIKGLNQSLADAKTAADAKDYAKAVQIMTQATQGDETHHLLLFKLGDYQRLEAANNPDKSSCQARIAAGDKSTRRPSTWRRPRRPARKARISLPTTTTLPTPS